MLDSPVRYIALTISGILLAGLGFVAAEFHAVGHSLPLLSLCFVCVVVGTVGSFWFPVQLKEAVRNERWSDTTLEPYREMTSHLLWRLATGSLLLVMIAGAIRDHHHPGWFWPAFLMLQTQAQLGRAFLRPRKPRGPGTRLDWSQVAPLTSQHWGER